MNFQIPTTRRIRSVSKCGMRNAECGMSGPVRRFNAFTLIELLVVIAVITVLAALLIPAGGIMVQKAQIQRATSERELLTTAIENYKSRYGFFPPSNTNVVNAMTNQLYYELMGTTMTVSGSASNFTTLDNATLINGNTILGTYGVGGFLNCTKSGGGAEDSLPAKQFLSGLKPSEIASNGIFSMIVTSANSDAGYQPVPGVSSLTGRPANPWRYRCPGTNNPSSYDLWVDVYVGGKTDLICNWVKAPIYNTAY
jgi:prepilin-type N-terminal cleavage/methylation domain-containing protein